MKTGRSNKSNSFHAINKGQTIRPTEDLVNDILKDISDGTKQGYNEDKVNNAKQSKYRSKSNLLNEKRFKERKFILDAQKIASKNYKLVSSTLFQK